MALLGATALAQTTSLLTGGGETSQFTVLVNGVGDPVDARITTDSRVARVDHNNFEEFVGTVLSNPVGVQNSEVTANASSAFFGNSAVRSLVLQAVDTMGLGLAVSNTLRNGSLSATTTNADTVDNVSLLGLVAQSSSLVGAGGVAGTVDGGELSVFPASHSQQKSEGIRLFLLPKFLQVFVGTYKIVDEICELDRLGKLLNVICNHS
jgi:hypothetical protein